VPPEIKLTIPLECAGVEAIAQDRVHRYRRTALPQNAAAKPPRLAPAIPLCQELIIEELNRLVPANLLDVKPGDPSKSATPGAPAGKETEGRQQHCRCLDPGGRQRAFVHLLDRSVGETVETVEDE
jgi:hypothetical protein